MLTFNLHIGDWIKSTMHLTDSERGVYLSLLLRYYDTEKPLPASLEAIHRLLCVRNADAMRDVGVVLEEFFELTPDGWCNKRADEEIAAYREKSAKAKRSADARWAGSNHSQQADATAMRTQCEGNANHEPLTNNQDVSPNGDTRAPRSQSITAAMLVDQHGVDEQVAKDYLAIRKAKRAPLTATALAGLEREFKIAGLTVSAGIQICASRGWQGFSAKWLTNERGQDNGRAGQGRMSAVDRVRAANLEPRAGRTLDAE